jgi:hypothetical protein
MKPEENKATGNGGSRIYDNIKINLDEQGYEGVDSIRLAQDRETLGAVVNTVMNLCFHKRR